MTTIEIELAVLVVAVVAEAVFGLLIHYRMLGEILERQAVMDRYVKAVSREKLSVVREAQAAVDEAHVVREAGRESYRRLEQHLSDPRVKRLTDG